MSRFFAILMVLAMLAALGALLLGLFSLARGGEFNTRYGNRLMRLRVALQGLALLLFALAMLSAT